MNFITEHGLPLLFLAVMIESFGIPVPGETALIAFAILASQGHYPIALVISLAALAAIIGDNLGYWLIGRVGGRKLFHSFKPLRKVADKILPRVEHLMTHYGGRTVFFSRFITVLRYTAAWAAGLGEMGWGKFIFWNSFGGIVWAAGVGLIAYFAGSAAADAIKEFGLYAAIVVVVILIIIALIYHYGSKKLQRKLKL